MDMLHGYSLSLCVRSMMRGPVKEENVVEIICGTMCDSPESWARVFDMYRLTYWQTDPDFGEKIARSLLDAGKLTQPRLKDPNDFPDISDGVIWRDA